MTDTIEATTAPHPRRWLALAALLVAEAMNLLDATIVQVAAPVVHADLGGDLTDVQWFSTAYTLPFAVLLIGGGRVGDIIGRRRAFRIGVLAFLLASTACALAPSAGVLIGLRAVQGAAAALVIPQTIGLIKGMFQGAELPKALGMIGPVMGLAAVCGPLLGGLLTHADLAGSSWRSVFLVNVPLSLAVLAVGRSLREDRAPRRPGLDPVGTVLAGLGVAAVIYPLVEPGVPAAWSCVGLVVLAAFAVQQRHTRRPLVELSLFTGPVFPAALATVTSFFAVTTGLTLVVVLRLQLGIGATVLVTSLTLLPWSAAMGLSSWFAGARLVARFRDRTLFAGLAIALAGVLAAIAVPVRAGYPGWLLLPLAVIGLGVGLFTTSFFTAALHVVRPQEVGSAAGLINACQQLGATVGVAALGSVYLTAGTTAALGTAAAILLGTVVTSIVLTWHRA